MSDGKVTRAELAEAVRELREEVARLRAEQGAHACHACHCGHVCVVPVVIPPPPPLPPVWTQPYQITCAGSSVGVNPYPATCVAAGDPAGVPVLGYEMAGGSVVRSGYTTITSN
jgi:hypothetical protein